MKPGKVFISYSSLNYDKALELYSVLTNNGIECWMAPDSIPAGSDYAEEIPTAIEECSAFVVVLTKEAQESKWVPKELDAAITCDKVVVPFHMDDSALKKAFNFRLTNVQRIEAFGRISEAYQDLLSRLLRIRQAICITEVPETPGKQVLRDAPDIPEQHSVEKKDETPAVCISEADEKTEKTKFPDKPASRAKRVSFPKHGIFRKKAPQLYMPSGVYKIHAVGDIKNDLEAAGVSVSEKRSAFYNKFIKAYSSGQKLTELVLDGFWSVVPAHAWERQKISWLVLDENVRKIERYAFSDCDLKLVYIPSSVESIGEFAFANNNGLTVIFEEGDDRVISDFAFHNCSSLRVVCVSDEDTDTIEYCKQRKLNRCGVSSYEEDYIKYITHKYYKSHISRLSKSLRKALFGEDSQNGGRTGRYEAVLYPEWIQTFRETRQQRIQAQPDVDIDVLISCYKTKFFADEFSGSKRLTYAYISDGIIAERTFANCPELKMVVCDDSVVIGKEAFADCEKLEYVCIKGGSIGACAFQNCPNLKCIVLEGEVEIESEEVFAGCRGCTVVCDPYDNELHKYLKEHHFNVVRNYKLRDLTPVEESFESVRFSLCVHAINFLATRVI